MIVKKELLLAAASVIGACGAFVKGSPLSGLIDAPSMDAGKEISNLHFIFADEEDQGGHLLKAGGKGMNNADKKSKKKAEKKEKIEDTDSTDSDSDISSSVSDFKGGLFAKKKDKTVGAMDIDKQGKGSNKKKGGHHHHHHRRRVLRDSSHSSDESDPGLFGQDGMMKLGLGKKNGGGSGKKKRAQSGASSDHESKEESQGKQALSDTGKGDRAVSTTRKPPTIDPVKIVDISHGAVHQQEIATGKSPRYTSREAVIEVHGPIRRKPLIHA